MKTFNNYLVVIVSILLLASCLQLNTDEGTPIEMGVTLSGDVVELLNQEMTKSEASADIFALNVYKDNKYYTSYVYSPASSKFLKLDAGHIYSFVGALIVNGKNVLYSGNSRNGTVAGKPGGPYWLYDCGGKSAFATEDGCVTIGQQTSRELNLFNDALTKSGEAHIIYQQTLDKNQNVISKTPYAHPYNRYCVEVDRFVGRVDDIVPTVGGIIDIPLKRVSFGLKVKLTGVADGSVSIDIHNTDVTFLKVSSLTSGYISPGKIYSLRHVKDAYTYAHLDYQEPVTMSVTWTRGNGIVQNLGTKTIYMKRNCMNVINLKLSTNDTDVDVDVDPEEGGMDDEDEDLSS